MYRGRFFWIACDVGRLLGYCGRCSYFVSKITDGSHDLVEGVDYDNLHDDDLASMKRAFANQKNEYGVRYKYAKSLLILYESGLYKMLAYTNKDINKKTRFKILSMYQMVPALGNKFSTKPKKCSVNPSTVESVVVTFGNLVRKYLPL